MFIVWFAKQKQLEVYIFIQNSSSEVLFWFASNRKTWKINRQIHIEINWCDWIIIMIVLRLINPHLLHQVECCGADSPQDWIIYNSTLKQINGLQYNWPLSCCKRLSTFEVEDPAGCIVGKNTAIFNKVGLVIYYLMYWKQQTATNPWFAGLKRVSCHRQWVGCIVKVNHLICFHQEQS